jgi:hypothetical protein
MIINSTQINSDTNIIHDDIIIYRTMSMELYYYRKLRQKINPMYRIKIFRGLLLITIDMGC